MLSSSMELSMAYLRGCLVSGGEMRLLLKIPRGFWWWALNSSRLMVLSFLSKSTRRSLSAGKCHCMSLALWIYTPLGIAWASE